LTVVIEPNNVKFMSRFIFAAAVSLVVSRAAAAQRVPGRDLLEFPLGTLAESPPLTRQIVGGLWNPASGVLPGSDRSQVGFAALTTPYEQGVESKLIAGAFRLRPNLSAAASFAQASIADVFKTETDPNTQSLGDAIPYGTMLLSVGLAKKFRDLDAGVSARYRWGSLDTTRAGAISFDAGVMIDRVLGSPVRLGASTFLLSPARKSESATYLIGADVPLIPTDSIWALRAGVSAQHTDGRGHEEYLFATARYRGVDASIGLSQSAVFGNVNRRLRIGLGLHYAKYGVAIAREDGAAGIGASNQFLLTSAFR
jgi:hypothetical protein